MASRLPTSRPVSAPGEKVAPAAAASSASSKRLTSPRSNGSATASGRYQKCGSGASSSTLTRFSASARSARAASRAATPPPAIRTRVATSTISLQAGSTRNTLRRGSNLRAPPLPSGRSPFRLPINPDLLHGRHRCLGRAATPHRGRSDSSMPRSFEPGDVRVASVVSLIAADTCGPRDRARVRPSLLGSRGETRSSAGSRRRASAARSMKRTARST